MTGFSNTFLLISIFIRPSLCEDSEKKGKQDLIVAVISVVLLISVLLVVGCCFIHYKLITENMTLMKEAKPFAIQTRQMETTVLLAPPQAAPLTASQQQPPQPTAAPKPSPQGTPPPKRIPSQLSINLIYSSYSSESFHPTELGSIHSVDHGSWLEGSPRSTSRESLDSKGSKAQEQEESSGSESFILCPIQQM